MNPFPIWQSTQATRACGETRYVEYSGGIVWQLVPQNAGELVYSHPYAAAVSNIRVNTPRTAYGKTRNHVGVPSGGKKNDLILLRIFFTRRFSL